MSELARFPDWPARLAREIETVRAAPLEAGRDCWIFAADCVRAITGVDIAEGLRGRYADLAEGMELVRRERGGPLRVLWQALGRPVPPARARRGDVVARRTDGGTALGVVLGHVAAFRTTPRGLAFVPLETCVAAWRVG